VRRLSHAFNICEPLPQHPVTIGLYRRYATCWQCRPLAYNALPTATSILSAAARRISGNRCVYVRRVNAGSVCPRIAAICSSGTPWA
jgi:hypothetical protein